MSQKAIDKRNPLETKDAVWVAIRKLRTFSPSDLYIATRCGKETIREYIAGLLKAGYLGIHDEPTRIGMPFIYELVRDTGVDAPRVRRDGSEITQGRGRENMWRTMRIITEFSYRDLAIHASTEEYPVAEGEARSYCYHLHKAGYLAEVSKGKPGSVGNLARYRLLKSKNSGPKPPQVQRVKQVYDPNLKKVVWSEDQEPSAFSLQPSAGGKK